MGGIHKVIILLVTLMSSFSAHQYKNDLNGLQVKPTLSPPLDISAESISTDFTFLIPTSSDRIDDMGSKVAYIDLINPNSNEALVQIINYQPNYHESTAIKTQSTVLVNALSSEKVIFNSSSINKCYGTGFVKCPNTHIQVHSDLPISVLASIYTDGKYGDSFNVMPTSMAHKTYALSLMADDSGEYSTVYFLPIDKPVNISITITEAKSTKQVNAIISNNLSTISAYLLYNEFTMYISGDQEFVVIATLSNIPILILNVMKYDFGVYMPTPILDTDCSLNMIDEHVAILLDTRFLTFAMPNITCPVDVYAYGDNGVQSEAKNVKWVYFDPKFKFGNTVGLKSSGAVQVVQVGGMYMQKKVLGFLEMVLSISQFVTGRSAFVVPTNNNSHIVLIGDEDTKLMTVIDQKFEIDSLLWAPIHYLSDEYFYVSITLSEGFHYLESTGKYTIFVYGINNGAGYGFAPVYGSQKLPK